VVEIRKHVFHKPCPKTTPLTQLFDVIADIPTPKQAQPSPEATAFIIMLINFSLIGMIVNR